MWSTLCGNDTSTSSVLSRKERACMGFFNLATETGLMGRWTGEGGSGGSGRRWRGWKRVGGGGGIRVEVSLKLAKNKKKPTDTVLH